MFSSLCWWGQTSGGSRGTCSLFGSVVCSGRDQQSIILY